MTTRCCPPARQARFGLRLPLPQSRRSSALDLCLCFIIGTLFSKVHPRRLLISGIMVAQYTVFGRQVGSHVVSLLPLSPRYHAFPFPRLH